MQWDEVRAGAVAVAPMLFGVVPFGLVFGATTVADGLGTGVAVGMSTLVFAGASQLAAVNVLADGGSVWVAAAAAWMINLRLVLYSASLAPHLAHVSLARRMGIAYVLTDQAYAVSIVRWDGRDDRAARVPFILGSALLLWVCWQAATIAGALASAAVPDDLPLDFAVPLVFLVLLVPTVTNVPSIVAAIVGGAVTVVASVLGAGHLALIVGALSGIAAGAVVDAGRPQPPPPLEPPGAAGAPPDAPAVPA